MGGVGPSEPRDAIFSTDTAVRHRPETITAGQPSSRATGTLSSRLIPLWGIGPRRYPRGTQRPGPRRARSPRIQLPLEIGAPATASAEATFAEASAEAAPTEASAEATFAEATSAEAA